MSSLGGGLVGGRSGGGVRPSPQVDHVAARAEPDLASDAAWAGQRRLAVAQVDIAVDYAAVDDCQRRIAVAAVLARDRDLGGDRAVVADDGGLGRMLRP